MYDRQLMEHVCMQDENTSRPTSLWLELKGWQGSKEIKTGKHDVLGVLINYHNSIIHSIVCEGLNISLSWPSYAFTDANLQILNKVVLNKVVPRWGWFELFILLC